MKRIICAGLLLALALALCACRGQKAPDQGAFTWQIELTEHEVKEALHTTEGVKQYEGDVLNVDHDDAPGDGDVFLILTLKVAKAQPGGGRFDWARLTVKDGSGNAYARMDNDAFLTAHGYQRMPGTALQIGENAGSVCFELPAEAVKGSLTLEYDAGDEGINTMPIR